MSSTNGDDNTGAALVAGVCLLLGGWGAWGFWDGVIAAGVWLVWIVTVDEVCSALRGRT